MSLIAGVLRYDRSQIMVAEEIELLDAFRGERYRSSRPVQAPGLLMLVAPTKDTRNDPVNNDLAVSAARNICLWDGRLDNHDEIAGQVGRERACSDALLAMCSYEKHGAAGFGDLIGDWSLAIWDHESSALFLASDYAGVRPLFYAQGSESVRWSSSLEHLVSSLGDTRLDEEYAADYLTGGSVGTRTPYRAVRCIPPGHFLRFCRGQVQSGAFWSMPVESRIQCSDRGDYAGQLRALFHEAVACRLRDSGPVAAELSGGLDSSSVVCAASSSITNRAVNASRLVTFNYTHPQSRDSLFCRHVEQFCGVSSISLDTERHPFATADYTGLAAPLCWAPRLAEVARRMDGAGVRTLLTGQLGDLTMCNWIDDSEQIADYWRQGSILGAVEEALAWSRSLRAPALPLFWRAIRANYGSWSGLWQTAGDSDNTSEDSITTRLKSLAGYTDRKRSQARAWKHESPARQKRFWALSDILESRFLQCPEPLQHLSQTHPFSHRPLVEFMLGIPAAVGCRPGEPRRLMRQAFSGLLPEAVLRRRSKATFNSVVIQALVPMAAALLRSVADLRVVDLGYVKRESIEDRLKRFIQGVGCNELQLQRVILYEYWLRSREAAATPMAATA